MKSRVLDYVDHFGLGKTVYLDGANQGPMPLRSLAAAERALGWKRDPSTLDDGLYFELPDRIRRSASRLLTCDPDNVAIATGASHGISLVACGLDWRPGDHVVVPRGEFPANSLPWMALRGRGVDVELVDAEHVLEAIRPDTRAVSVGHVNFANGRRIDLEAIGAVCAEHDILYLVDASQSVGVMPFDVGQCRASVVAVAGYKWLMSPYGTGLTYVRPDCVERFRLPTFNWATIVGANDFNRLVDLEPRHRPGAIRFDVPETAAFVNGVAMAESLELLVQVGVDAVFAHATALIDRIVEQLPEPYRSDSPAGPEARSSILRIVGPDEAATHEAHRRLRAAGVAVSMRESGLRVAPGLWSGPRAAARLLEVLTEAAAAL